MYQLTANQIEEVSGGSIIHEFVTVLSGAALGCGVSIKLLSNISVAWLGIVPLSLPIAGAIIGGAIGQTLYNIEQISIHAVNALEKSEA